MKQIAEKYPKGWELALEGMHEKYQPRIRAIHGLMYAGDIWLRDFQWYFGYLVLEFFPKHGVEIERLIKQKAWSGESDSITYRVVIMNDYIISYRKTPQEAIEKAFEILEKKLESK